MQLYWNKTPAQVFSCKYCQIFKNNCFEKHPRPVTRRRSDVVTTSLGMSQRRRRYVSNETPTSSRWNVAKTSQWYVSTISYWNVVTMSQEDVAKTSHQYVSSTSLTSLKWNTQRRLSGTSPRRLNGTYLVSLYDISCKSQMKHSITPLWYVSTTSQSYIAATTC